MTRPPEYGTEAGDRLRELMRMVPGLPDDLEQRADERIRSILPHTQVQMLIYACQTLVPGLSRDAFHPDARVSDLLYWLADGAPAPEPSARLPRGSYTSAGGTTLRPLVDADFWPLYMASLEPRNAHRWRWRGHTPSPDVFRHTLYGEAVLAQFMVIVDGDLNAPPIGSVLAYNADMTARHCSVAAQRLSPSNDPKQQGLMIEGTLVLIQYLFDHFNFHKVYFEVPEYNLTMFFGGDGALLVSEADQPDHYWYGDRYWSKRTFALYRSTWEEVAPLFRGEWPEGHFDAIVS